MLRIFLLLFVFAGFTAWAQDDSADTETESTPPAEVEEEVDEYEDLDLDDTEDHTEEDEDVFRPTDVVSYQQSVPFSSRYLATANKRA